MPPDPSNARDGTRDPTGGKKEPEASAAPVPIDAEDEGRALLGELTVGSVVDGKYRVDEVLGRGAMGVVVAATHLELGERVALKFLRYRAKSGVNDDFASRFKREARVSAKLKNEHITRVIDVGMWRDHVPYMVMDYLAGTDLREVMKAAGPLPIGTAIEFTVQMCEGIAEAHAHGVVHRDLKPSNLFVTKRPDGSDLIKILDFGISKWSVGEAGVDELTQTGVVLGSPKYMAPEQLFGSSEVDARADVWSVGCILYEMLCGRPPFDLPSFTKICAELSTERPPPSLVARRPEITSELEAVVMKCFVRTPEDRIQSVADLAGDVLAAVQAPFADAVRAKIAFTLDPKSSRDPMGTSGGMGMQTGSYGSILTQSGSRSAVQAPAAAAESTGASPTSISGALAEPERRRWVLWLVPAAALVVGGGLFLALSGKGEPPPATPARDTATAGATTSVPVPHLDPPATATATTAAATATAATASVAAPPASASPASTVPRAVVVRGGGGGGGWHPAPRPMATTPTLATAAPPTATAAPVATTTTPPAPKPDPLGDRQ
jgi:serine/threonine-protein kinase